MRISFFHHPHPHQIELVSQRVLLRDVPVAKLSSSAIGPQPTIHQVIIFICVIIFIILIIALVIIINIIIIISMI